MQSEAVDSKINPGGGVHVTALAGKQRRFWEWNSSWLWGADAEWEINDAFKEKFGNDYGLTIGASYIGKHDPDEQIMYNGPTDLIPNYDPSKNYYLNLPLNVAAFDGRVKLRAHDFNFLAEFATKSADPVSLYNYNYRKVMQSFFQEHILTRVSRQCFRQREARIWTSESKRVIEGDYLISSFVNHMPAFTMTQTYALAAMYPCATQAEGEWAFQADVRYLFKKKTPLGGKYGTNVRLSASYISGLDYNLPPGTSYKDKVLARTTSALLSGRSVLFIMPT